MVKQAGGTHYEAPYQHWDWVSDISLGYLGANATKYITRHQRKHGRQDIEKALTYVQKMREVTHDRWGSLPCHIHGHDMVIARTLQLANNLSMPEREHRMCIWIATAVDVDDLIEVEVELEQMLSEMPRDTEEAAMRGFARGGTVTSTEIRIVGERSEEFLAKPRTEHPAPFGYEDND